MIQSANLASIIRYEVILAFAFVRETFECSKLLLRRPLFQAHLYSAQARIARGAYAQARCSLLSIVMFEICQDVVKMR